MSSWKTVTHKEDKEFRKKRNAASKEKAEIKAKIKAKKKNKAKEQREGDSKSKDSKEGKTVDKKHTHSHTAREGTKKKQNKKKEGKVEFVKCEKAESKEGCADLWCPLSHKSCRLALDCNKNSCSYIHVPSPLDTPSSREECLIFSRLYQFTRLQAAVNPKGKAVGKLTLDKFQEKIQKARYPCDAFISLRGDWTWQAWAELFEKEHQLESGYFTKPELQESDLAQLFEFFFSDLQEHWYIHKEHYAIAEEEKEEEEDKEEEEQEEQQLTFDNERIDVILKEANGSTFSQILDQSFAAINDEKKIKQALNCWKCVFYARASKSLISLPEEQACHLLDILIEFIEKGSTEYEPFDNIKFEVDPVLLAIKSFSISKEIGMAWKKFITDKKTTEILEILTKATGASPIVHGFSSFPSFTFTFKMNMNVFLFPEPSLEKHAEAVKKVYKEFQWVFALAEILQAKTGDFYIFESIQDAKNYGSLYDEFTKQIQENWK